VVSFIACQLVWNKQNCSQEKCFFAVAFGPWFLFPVMSKSAKSLGTAVAGEFETWQRERGMQLD